MVCLVRIALTGIFALGFLRAHRPDGRCVRVHVLFLYALIIFVCAFPFLEPSDNCECGRQRETVSRNAIEHVGFDAACVLTVSSSN